MGVEVIDGQSVLLRVATLVARGASLDDVFAVAAEEGARLLGVDHPRIRRHQRPAGAVCVVGRRRRLVGLERHLGVERRALQVAPEHGRGDNQNQHRAHQGDHQPAGPAGDALCHGQR